MNRTSFLLIVAGVLLNVAAQLLLKAGTRVIGVIEPRRGELLSSAISIATQPHIIVAVMFYLLSLVIWIVALSRVPVSIAYPMLSMGYVVNAVAAWWLFGELLTPMKLAGMLVILAGVFMLARA